MLNIIKYSEWIVAYMQFSTISPNASIAAAFSSTWAFSIVILRNFKRYKNQDELFYFSSAVSSLSDSSSSSFSSGSAVVVSISSSSTHSNFRFSVAAISYITNFINPKKVKNSYYFNPIKWSKRFKYRSQNFLKMFGIKFSL
jgi:hypothetical protein